MTTASEPQTPASFIEDAISRLKLTVGSITPEMREQLRREADAAERSRKEMRVAHALRAGSAPRRQLENTAVDRSGEWGATEAKIKPRLGTGLFLALIGNRGCGKTQLAVEAMRHVATQIRPVRYCTATGFFIEVKAAYNSQTRSEKDVLRDFSYPSLLVIDEIGQRSESEWENRLLFELLNCRYNAVKDTILISNQGADEFGKSIGPSLLSRMNEAGGMIECKWPSYRTT